MHQISSPKNAALSICCFCFQVTIRTRSTSTRQFSLNTFTNISAFFACLIVFIFLFFHSFAAIFFWFEKQRFLYGNTFSFFAEEMEKLGRVSHSAILALRCLRFLFGGERGGECSFKRHKSKVRVFFCFVFLLKFHSSTFLCYL